MYTLTIKTQLYDIRNKLSDIEKANSKKRKKKYQLQIKIDKDKK
jgi:hypothetical protein